MTTLKSSGSGKKPAKRSAVRSSKNVTGLNTAPKVVASISPVSEAAEDSAVLSMDMSDAKVRLGELAGRVAERLDVKKRDAKIIGQATIDILIESLQNGETLVMPSAKISMQRKKDLEKGAVIIAKIRVKGNAPAATSFSSFNDDEFGGDD